MLELLSRNWWTLVLRGIAAIVFGLLAWFYPGVTLAVLVIFFGVYALIDGLLALFAALAKRVPEDSRWLVGLLGALGVLIGALTLWRPAAAAIALLMYIAAWSLVMGVLQVVAAIRLRKEIQGEFWLGLAGALSIAFAVLILVSPGVGALSIIWVIAGFAILYGHLPADSGFQGQEVAQGRCCTRSLTRMLKPSLRRGNVQMKFRISMLCGVVLGALAGSTVTAVLILNRASAADDKEAAAPPAIITVYID